MFVSVSCSDIEVFPPFPALSQSMSTHVTYLDTIGRPAVTFHYQNLTDRHTGTIYVRFTIPSPSTRFAKCLTLLCSPRVLLLFAVGITGNVQSPPLRPPPKAESGPDRFPRSVRYRLGSEESRFEVDEALEGGAA